jgi:hypothetical protein
MERGKVFKMEERRKFILFSYNFVINPTILSEFIWLYFYKLFIFNNLNVGTFFAFIIA